MAGAYAEHLMGARELHRATFTRDPSDRFSDPASRTLDTDSDASISRQRKRASSRPTCDCSRRQYAMSERHQPLGQSGRRSCERGLSWIGLEYLEIVSASYYGEPLLYPENVVLAGHGLGLCQPYTSPYSCLDDESQLLPGVSYFLVGHHANALEVIITSTTYVAYGVTPGNFLDYNLGAEARHRNPDEEYYWEQVRQLLHIPLIRRKLETPSKLVYYGDYSDDIHLRTVVREVMRSFLDEDDMPETVADGIDPVFAGAFGAAEFAKRKPYWDKKDQQSVVSVAPKSDL